ncbi:hypothetical protein PIB30_094163 [Stylosanthes scabra]|uniref:Uncharacterized protein n=1 Tax=Stylosanthes scabra TaxID=79078 RepID=A0ABU6RVS4_9FABA|nr:hypothetical protein [Stylosanthes scabra]
MGRLSREPKSFKTRLWSPTHMHSPHAYASYSPAPTSLATFLPNTPTHMRSFLRICVTTTMFPSLSLTYSTNFSIILSHPRICITPYAYAWLTHHAYAWDTHTHT